MSNQIQPTCVTFEQAKWLKEKGYKESSPFFYFEDGQFQEFIIRDTYGYYGEEYTVELEEFDYNWNDGFLTKKDLNRCFGCSKTNGYLETFTAPEQWQVVEWLRVNHGIWIEIHHIKTYHIDRFHLVIWDYKNTEDYMTIYHDGVGPGYKVWDTPQEAYSAAFDYIQENNLI